MQYTVTVYVDDLLVTCKDEITIAWDIAALKVKYRDVKDHTGAKQLCLGICC